MTPGVLGLLALTLAAQPVATASDPTTEVASLLRSSAAAWSRGDIDAFVSYYADDVVFISPNGEMRGRQAVLHRYRTRYPDRASMGKLTLTPLDTRVSPGTATSVVSVVARWTLEYPDKGPATGFTLVVLHRTDQGWRIVQDASM